MSGKIWQEWKYVIIVSIVIIAVTGLGYLGIEKVKHDVFAYEIEQCNALNDNGGWSKSYQLLRCYLKVQEVYCYKGNTTSTIAEQKIRSIEKLSDSQTRLKTVEGFEFVSAGTVRVDDIAIINKTWNNYREEVKEIVTPKEYWEKYDTLEGRITLEKSFVYYVMDGNIFGGKEFPRSSESTSTHKPNFCNDLSSKTIKYELVGVNNKDE